MAVSPLDPAKEAALAPQGSDIAPAPASTQSTVVYPPAFQQADAFVAYHEGGKTVNDGIGHRAAFGIDQNAHPEIDVLSLTPRQAQAIRHTYWEAINGDRLAKIDPKAAMIAYDTAITSGPQKAVELIKLSGGDPTKMYQARVNFIEHLIQQDPDKYGPVAATWRRLNDNLGKVTGVISGQPDMPPLAQLISKDGVYVPTGYSVDVNTPVSTADNSIRRQASPLTAETSQKTPAAPEPSTAKTLGDQLEAGFAGASNAGGAAPQTPKIEAPKPNVALPQGPIAPDHRELYAKALEKISSRANAAPGQPSPVTGTPVAPQETYQEKTAREAQMAQPPAPKQEPLNQNDEAA